jgi:hypothetical protein
LAQKDAEHREQLATLTRAKTGVERELANAKTAASQAEQVRALRA